MKPRNNKIITHTISQYETEEYPTMKWTERTHSCKKHLSLPTTSSPTVTKWKKKNEDEEKRREERKTIKREIVRTRDKSFKGGKPGMFSRLWHAMSRKAVHPVDRGSKIEGRFPVSKKSMNQWSVEHGKKKPARYRHTAAGPDLNLRARMRAFAIPKIGRTVRQLRAELTSSFIVANSVRLTVDPSVH